MPTRKVDYKTYIAFEGIDGSGKGTQIAKTCKFMGEQGIEHFVLKHNVESRNFFGGIWRKLQKKRSRLLGSFVNATTFALDVLESQGKLKNKLNKHSVIIGDRSHASTLAYGLSAYPPLPEKKLAEVVSKAMTLHNWRPDLIFLLDIDAEEAMKRIGANPGMYERQENLTLARNEFLRIAKKPKNLPMFKETEFVVINTKDKNPDLVWEEIRKKLIQHLNLNQE